MPSMFAYSDQAHLSPLGFLQSFFKGGTQNWNQLPTGGFINGSSMTSYVFCTNLLFIYPRITFDSFTTGRHYWLMLSSCSTAIPRSLLPLLSFPIKYSRRHLALSTGQFLFSVTLLLLEHFANFSGLCSKTLAVSQCLESYTELEYVLSSPSVKSL